MKSFRIQAILAAALLLSLIPTFSVQAARGVPGSPEFGYGAALYTDSPSGMECMTSAASLHLDWLAIEVSWNSLQPDANAALNFSVLDAAVQAAAAQNIPVLVRFSSPPPWAFGANGPDPAAAAAAVQQIFAHYGSTIQALELLPGANTVAGWGTSPNPGAYAALFTAVRQANPNLLLVAAGLRQVQPGGTDMDDLVFLNGLYQAGLGSQMPVLSLELTDLLGDPLTAPGAGDVHLLRRYELIRQVMVANGHEQGRIWITKISLASGTIDSLGSPEAQALWLSQAAQQIRSQLYIGMAVFASLNPSATANRGDIVLFPQAAGAHPFYGQLKSIILQNNPELFSGIPGRLKDEALNKTKT